MKDQVAGSFSRAGNRHLDRDYHDCNDHGVAVKKNSVSVLVVDDQFATLSADLQSRCKEFQFSGVETFGVSQAYTFYFLKTAIISDRPVLSRSVYHRSDSFH